MKRLIVQCGYVGNNVVNETQLIEMENKSLMRIYVEYAGNLGRTGTVANPR